MTTEWLPHPDTWENPDDDFQRLYPAVEVGTDIVDALRGGARLMTVSIGQDQFQFQTHGFPQAAKPLIDFCESGTAPAPTPAPAPQSTPSFVAVTADIEEFAETCADIRNRDESAPQWTFEAWVAEAQAVEVPPVLTEWWSAYVDQFALQLTHDGPCEYSQGASDTTLDQLALMDFRLREYLVDGGCITGVEVWQAEAVWAGWGRLLDGFGQGQNVSVEEFAEACADIKATVPTLDNLIAIPQHLAYWWEQLNPPPELRRYHAAVADFYREWIETGGGDPQTDVSFETQMALIEVAQDLDEDVLETLLARRCAG